TPVWTLSDLTGITTDDIAITYDLANYPMRVYVQVTRNVSLIGATFKLHLVDSGNTLTEFVLNVKVIGF
ncbi:MAG: hypothetical protein PHS59_18425, partial [Paludibacter sp.]|nr:hypothetical protein [Paludibacter sp.]